MEKEYSKKEKNFWKFILENAKKQRRKIGIGITRVTPRIIKSLKEAQKYTDIIVVGQKIKGFKSVKSKSLDPLIKLAKDGKVDAIVRGNFDALDAYNAARRVLRIKGSILEAIFFKLNGVKMVNENISGFFCLLPGSFVNDRTILDKIKSIDLHIEFFKKIGLEPRIGILGPGKLVDVFDGVPEVNQGLAESQLLLNWYKEKGIWAKFFNHQIEYAVQEANIVVAQNSWAGNLACHCLIYLGNVDLLGSAALNITDIVYVDNSEAMQDFTNSLIFAAFLSNIKTK